ncbi:MAG: glycosyltransferase family 39 protein [Candidatus Hinthialibacter antarcticus]|nr:glycosyltransferase family 39 protein [Candidatus Hinthialibacter antarcticus]
MISKRNSTGLLLLILVLGALLRVPAARFASPYSYNWDESSYIYAAHRMLSYQSLKYTWFNVPPFFLYQQISANAAHYAWALGTGTISSLDEVHIQTSGINRNISPSSLLFFCRMYTVFLGLCSIGLVYALGARIANASVGLIAAFLLAIAPGFIEHSLFVTMDLPLAFMAALTVYVSLSMSKHPTYAAYFSTSFFAGLTAATKYNGAMIWLLPFALHCKHFKWRFLNVRLVFLIVTLFFAFSLACPWWNSMDDFTRQVGIEIQHYGRDIEYLTGSSMYGWAFVRSWAQGGFGVLPLLFAFGGMLAFALSSSKHRAAILMFPLAYFAMLAIQKADFIRNAVAMLPFLALFAAYGVERLSAWIVKCTGWKFTRTLLIAAVSLQPLIQGGQFAWDLSQLTDTRTQAVAWLNAHVPPGGRVLMDENLAVHPEDLARARFEYDIAPINEWRQRDTASYSYLVSVDEFVAEDLVKHWRYEIKNWNAAPYELLHEFKRAPLPAHLAASLEKIEQVNHFLYEQRKARQFTPDMAFPAWSSLSLFDAGTSYLGRASVNPPVAVYRPID